MATAVKRRKEASGVRRQASGLGTVYGDPSKWRDAISDEEVESLADGRTTPRMIEPHRLPFPTTHVGHRAWVMAGQLDDGRWVWGLEANDGPDDFTNRETAFLEATHRLYFVLQERKWPSELLEQVHQLANDDQWPPVPDGKPHPLGRQNGRASRDAKAVPKATCQECGIEFEHNDGESPTLCGACDPETNPRSKVKAPKPKSRGLSTVTPAGIRAIDPEAAAAKTVVSPREVESRLLPLADIARNRFNPREHFDDAEIGDLAGSLTRHDMILPVVVRRIAERREALTGNPGARHEIVAGERRALAALKAGWSHVPVRVIEADDARACELAIAENRDRRDISQVEYARGLQKLADLKGLDPKQLAEDQGLAEGTVRNLFRLLKTPAEFQQFVIDGKIDGTHLRIAAPYLHAPEIAKALRKSIDKAKDKFSVETWTEEVADVVAGHSERLARWGIHGEIEIKPSHPRYGELDVVETKFWNRTEKRALNRALAKELLAELEKAKEAKSKRKTKGAPNPEAAAEKRRKAEAAKASRTERLKGVLFHWQCWLVAENLDLAPEGTCGLILYAAAAGCALPNADDLSWEAGKLLRAKSTFASSGDLLKLGDRDELGHFVEAAARALFWLPDQASNLKARTYVHHVGPAEEVRTWIKHLGIDPLAEWRRQGDDGKQTFLGPLTETWLELSDREQLAELAKEWKVPIMPLDTAADLRRKLVANQARVMPFPRELAELMKGTTKAKRRAK